MEFIKTQLLLLFLLLAFPENYQITPNVSNTTSDTNDINYTFTLLEEGETKIELNEQYKNVILVLGNTGSGKSTFVQWIAGDDSKLISKEVTEGSAEFTIEDNNNRISSSSKSKTIFPELVLDRKTNSAYYDCPGFSDTRSTSYDIAATYFNKKLADYVSHVKIALVVSYPSVRKGVDRQDFMRLIRHTTDLIKDTRKFENSIAIVITKVDNTLIKIGKHYSLVPDENIIESIADFLKTFKDDLQEKSNLTDVDGKEKSFLNNAIALVDILCIKNNNNYTRIGIFKRPDASGPLSRIPLIRQEKEFIKKMLNDEISFTKKSNNDFGYTVSDKSKNDINILVERINEKVWHDISEIADKVQEQYKLTVEEIQSNINSLVDNSAEVCIIETEAQVLSTKLNTGSLIVSRLLTETKNISSLEDLAKKTENSITRSGISTCVGNINNISNYGRLFSFLQLVSDRNLNALPWSDAFKKVDVFVSNSKENTEESIHRAAAEIKNKIISHTKNFAKEITAQYPISHEFEQWSTELDKGFQFMTTLIEKVSNLSSAQEFSEIISENMISSDFADYSTIGKDVFSIFKLGKYLSFLKILNNGTLNEWSSEWVKPLYDIKKYLTESEKWYTFLEELYAKLSEYEALRIESKGGIIKTQLLEKYGINGRDAGKNMEYRSHLEALEAVSRLTLHQKVETDCSESGKLVIKGNFIRLGDFTDAIGKFLDICRNGVILNSVDIFALDTVFIDKDLRGRSKLQISIIAPKWQVRGTRTIDLDGSPGVPYVTKAKDGRNEGDNGSNGSPGLPGGAAGNFLGIAGKIIGGKNLTITASGGKGGPGQQGGNGRYGKNGESATTSDYFEKKFLRDDKIITGVYNSIVEQYRFYGKRGTNGGNGGQGGMGGIGGKKGEIRVFNLDENSNIPHIRSNHGSAGSDGKGGIGASGGWNGNNLYAEKCKENAYFFIAKTSQWCKTIPEPTGKRAASGASGKDGGNSQGRQPPEQSKDFQNVADTVNSYKVYLRTKLIYKFRKQALMQFVSQLEDDIAIKRSYDTLGLVNELLHLEEQFHTSSTEDFLPFYQSLLYRTWEYAQNVENSNKKALSYLYTAILSRIFTLKSSSEPNMVIDLENYLNLVKQNINSLTNLQEKSYRINVINQYKQLYKKNIDEKVKEANDFINNQVTFEIENINRQVADKIDILISETIELQKQARKEKDQLVQDKRKLENAITMSWVFSGLKIFSQVVSLFSPLGAAAGSLIATTTGVAESLSLSDLGSVTQVGLPEGVVSTIQSIKILRDKKFTGFKRLLQNIYSEVNTLPEELSDTSEKVKNLITRLQAAQNGSDFKQIGKLEQELKQELRRKASELRNETPSTKAIAVITKVNKAMQFGTVAIDIYNKYKDDKQEMELLDEAIQQAGDKIRMFEQYETNIYEKITPMLRDVENDLNNVANQLSGKSQVVLDVTQWQVASFLKDVKLQMKQFTKGFAIEEDLARCIEKLEEAMTTLINIYDRIQHYQEQERLAVYMADISSPVANRISISNQKLGNSVNELEIVILSNLVLEQYKTAVNALTQQVFPFANLYLADITLPSHFQLQNDYKDLVHNTVKQVEAIQSKLKEYKTAIKCTDTYISRGWFNRDYVSTQPFFVWKNGKYREVISKLLSGQKVAVKANLYESDFDKDAIKFNEIGISFYSENATVTSELSNKLKGITVSATHLGNSYYRYNDNMYIITSDKQNIRFSMEKDAQGQPVHSNAVYQKIKSGDLMLSPYAMWEFQLITSTVTTYHRELITYKDKVNLELVGYGSYVTKGTNISLADIENYYRSVGMISVSDLCKDDEFPETALISETLPTLLPPTISAYRGGGGVTKSPTFPDHQGSRPFQDNQESHPFHDNQESRSVDVPSSATRPTPWITCLGRGFWRIQSFLVLYRITI